MKRTLHDVIETIKNGEFYEDYDQSSSDLKILNNTLKTLEVMCDPGWHPENMRQMAIKALS